MTFYCCRNLPRVRSSSKVGKLSKDSLRAPGPGIADLFGQLPTVLAFGRTQQGFQIKSRLPPRLRPHEELSQPVLHLLQFIPPLVQHDRLAE